MMRVECHHSGGLIMSATAVEAAPLLAWILHTGLNRPAGNASLNSLIFRQHPRHMLLRELDIPGNAMIGVIMWFEGRHESLAIPIPLLLGGHNTVRRGRAVQVVYVSVRI